MDVGFRQLFSARWGTSEEQFEHKVFRKCLFRHAFPFAGLLERWDPEFFREDFDLLRELATARNTEEVVSELNRFYGRNRRDHNFLRTMFYLRISGKRVLRLYRDLTRASEKNPVHAVVDKAKPAKLA